jgi:carboxymethylenebutenolidase
MNGPTVQRHTVEHEGARIPVFTARPAAAPRVTVVMFGAIWSVTEHIEDLCAQLARAGFGAVAPCLFRGQGIPDRAAPPEVLSRAFLDFDDRRCVRDLRAVVRAVGRGELGGPAGALVPLGFCLGGRFAHLLGAVSEHVAGVVNFYGRLRFARQPTKPFLPIELTGLIEVPYLGHFAQFDDLIPLADVTELRAALAERGVPHAIHVYEGARHGFVDPARPTEHHPEAAALAWSRTLDFLHQRAAS